MLIAYLDEFGHVGPYVSDEHKKFNQHPVFGYGGFVLPASRSRSFGATFTKKKRELFKTEIAKASQPHQWERKGNEFFSTGSIASHPEQIRMFIHLIKALTSRGGHIFYYGEEKAKGTLKETGVTPEVRTTNALKESINRLCTHAEHQDQELLVIMDQITDKSRREIIAEMYSHVYWRSQRHLEHPEMRRIVEAPLHIESNLNGSIQFADWICGLLSRLTHWQLVDDSQFGWASQHFRDALQGTFTYDSKLRSTYQRDIFNSQLLDAGASRFPAGSIGSEARIPEDFLHTLRKG